MDPPRINESLRQTNDETKSRNGISSTTTYFFDVCIHTLYNRVPYMGLGDSQNMSFQ